MAKFLQAPVEEPVVEPSPVALWEDPMFHQALAVMMLTALATLFVILLLRGFFMKVRRKPGKAAAQSTEGYSGLGLKSAKDPNQR